VLQPRPISKKNKNQKFMKRSMLSPLTSLTLALLIACLLSCNEQDEVLTSPAAQPSKKDMGSLQGPKSYTAGREDLIIFTRSVGDPLDLTTAKEWTANYRINHPGETESHFFGNEIIQQILNEAGCIGIRIYYATDEAGNKKLLLVGVDEMGNNLLPAEGARVDGEGNTVADYSFPCPNMCPPDDDL
jgi:hypothetical protein